MKGMGQIVSGGVRDESLHCEGITRLFHAFVNERDCYTPQVKKEIREVCHRTVELEDAFIDLAFEMGPVPGMSPKEIKQYIRYIADWRLGQLGLKPMFMIDEHPLPWLAPLLNGVEHANFFATPATDYSTHATPAPPGLARLRTAAGHANFFETRATEYSKAATRGNWNEVWDNFDRRKQAKVANDGAAAGLGAEVEAEGGLFAGATVAAE